jgi:hypothetical protein
MLYPNPHLQLMGALQFNAFDLYANQQGQLSPAQRKQIEGWRNQGIEACGAGLMLLWAGGLLLRAPLLMLLFMTAVVVSVFIALWQRAEEDLEEKVRSVTGRLEYFSSLSRPTLKINQQQFRVSRAVSEAFTQGRIYRVYFTAGSHTLLSAEVLS